MKKRIHGWAPNADQELILGSALSAKKEALVCWEKWKKNCDIDNADRGSYRMLPMVFSNLKDQLDKNDELVGKLKGTYRKSWFSNHMIMEAASTLFAHLKTVGVDPLLLKGVHLISSYYEEPACRPLGDADFLVSWGDAEKVDKLMMSQGWRMKYTPRSPVFNENMMSLIKSAGYINKKGYQCDLHWNIFVHRCYPHADDEFINRSVEFLMKGKRYRGLCPEDLFIHLLVHGAYPGLEPHIRWIPDVLSVIRKERDMDWDLVLFNVVNMNLEIPIQHMLKYVNSRFGNGEFNYLLGKFGCHPVSPRSKEIAAGIRPARTWMGHRIKGSLRLYRNYRIYMSEFRNETVSPGISGFVRYLKFKFNTENYFVLASEVFKKAAHILTSKIVRLRNKS